MKQFIYILCIPFLLYSCKNEEKTIKGFKIDGQIDKPQNSAIAKLFRLENKKIVTVDSTVIITDTFTFNGEVESPDMYYITIEGINGNVPILLENAEIKLEIYSDSLYASKLTGGKDTDYYMSYQNYIASLRNQYNKINGQFQAARQANDTIKINELLKQREGLFTQNDSYELEFMSKNTDATLSALILERNLNAKKFSFQEINDLYINFTDAVKNTRPAKTIANYIETNRKTAIGQPAPEFSGPTPDGKTLAFNDIKGKITLIDFWAAWCGPCRKENPNVVKVYEKYHDKGLEIIGVSLDGSPSQKDAKNEWLTAIEKDKLTWHHVSNLQHFNDPIAQQFNINSIPATFIIDAQGIIIAKDLRGKDLENKIAELLN